MADFKIFKMGENDISRCTEFLARAKGISIRSHSLSSDYLLWKYLSPETTENICLFLESSGVICAMVGGLVWRYNINGALTKVCFPIDWYSSINSPVKGSGRKIMKALMEMFPVSVAVGGTKICFQPQIALGFRDIGDVLLLGIDGKITTGIREIARRGRGFLFHPLRSFRAKTLGRRFIRRENAVFEKEDFSSDALLAFKGAQLFSRGVVREGMIEKWRHYLNQPFNCADIISVQLRGKASYLLVGEFTDARKGSLALADALLDPEHSIGVILSAFAYYAYSKSRMQALLITNDSDILSVAMLLGFRICDRLRTQYFAWIDGPVCVDIRMCPSVSFLSSDEMMYRCKKGE